MFKPVVLMTTILVAFHFAPDHAHAVDTFWIGSPFALYSDSFNWNGPPPASGVDVFIEDGTAQLRSIGGVVEGFAHDLTVGSGSAFSNALLDIVNVYPQQGGTSALSSSGTAFIGRSGQGVSGEVFVRGIGASWNNANDLVVGYQSSGTNKLNIVDGGSVTSGRGFIGYFPTGFGEPVSGTATINGSSSQTAAWNAGSDLQVGRGGTGTLNVLNGGDVSDGVGYVGLLSGSLGTVTLSGAGSTWTNSAHLIVGFQSAAANIVTVENGALLTSNSAYIGDDVTGVGTVNVTGSDSTWNSGSTGSHLRVGNFGDGTLNVTGGGQVSSSLGFIGYQSGSHGRVKVDGPTSRWTNTDGTLGVGVAGQGSLIVDHGGTVVSALGLSIGAQGSLVGNGTIIADVYNNNVVYPAPPVIPYNTLNIDGDYIQSSTGTLRVDLAFGEHGRLNVTGDVNLAGTIDVDWIVGEPFWQPSPGQTFPLLSWTGTRSGTFATVDLPDPAFGVDWELLYVSNAVLLRAPAPGLPGDYNEDGKVDAADYVRWRKNEIVNSALPNDNGLTTQADRFNLWRSNFGNMSGSGSGGGTSANSQVPEPSAVTLVVLGLVGLFNRSRCRPDVSHARHCITKVFDRCGTTFVCLVERTRRLVYAHHHRARVR